MLIIFTALYLYLGRHLINQTNGDRNRSDQQNNIKLALKAKEFASPDFSTGLSRALWNWFPHYTDGVVNPLWPWLAARIHLEGQSDEEFFIRGKWCNTWFTLGILLIGAGVLSRYFSLPATLNFLLLAGLGSFLPRAVWFQPEPLYFILFLAAWICALMTMLKNSLWRYTLFGVLTGLAYLTKASALPLMIAFLSISTLCCLTHWFAAFGGSRDHDYIYTAPAGKLIGRCQRICGCRKIHCLSSKLPCQFEFCRIKINTQHSAPLCFQQLHKLAHTKAEYSFLHCTLGR